MPELIYTLGATVVKFNKGNMVLCNKKNECILDIPLDKCILLSNITTHSFNKLSDNIRVIIITYGKE